MRLLSLASVFCLLCAGSLTLLAKDTPAAETGIISGKVVNSEGKGIGNAMVIVSAAPDTVTGDKNKDKSATTPLADKPKNKPGGVVKQMATKADGTFKIDGIPAGKYMVSAKAVGVGTGKVAVPITVTAGQETDTGTIVLKSR